MSLLEITHTHTPLTAHILQTGCTKWK